MTKRWLAVFLAAMMCFSLLPMSVAAEEEVSQLWFRTMEETESGTYAVTDNYLSALSMNFGERIYGVFYYGTVDDRVPVNEGQLSDPGNVGVGDLSASLLDDPSLEGYAVRVTLHEPGEEYYVAYGNTRMDVSPILPDVGLYKADVRHVDHFLYETVGYGPTTYLLTAPGCVITEIIMDEGEDCEFLNFVLSDDNTMATLALDPGFSTTARYNLAVKYTSNGEKKEQSLSFYVTDLSEPYLKVYALNNNSGVYSINYSYSDTQIEGELGEDGCWIIYFADGYTETPVPASQLTFTAEDVVEKEPLDGNTGFFQLNYLTPTGDTPVYIEYEYALEDKVYQLPVTIRLPYVSIYKAPTASADTYLGYDLSFYGNNIVENGVAYDEYYLICTEGDPIETIENRNDEDMPFFSYEVLENTPHIAKLTVKDGFDNGKNYRMRVTLDGGNHNFNLRIYDARAQLFFDSTSRQDNKYTERTNIRVRKEDSLELGGSSTFIFYFGTSSSFRKVPLDQLTISDNLTKDKVSESKVADGLYGYVGNISGTDFGEGTVSYTVDGKTYSVTFQVILPCFGIYSASSASESAYMEELVYDGKDDSNNPIDAETFYVICTDNSYTINAITGEDDGDYMTFAPVSSTCWKLILSKGFTSGEDYRIIVSYQDEKGNEWEETLWISLLDNSPSLSFRRLVWDGAQYTAADASVARYSENMTITEPIYGVFYYGTKTDLRPVKVNALAFDGVSAVTWSDEDLDSELGGYAVELSATQAGKATVTYNGLNFTIAVTEREYEGELGYDGSGFYTSLDKETCIRVEDASGFPGDPVNLYYMWDYTDGTPDKITVSLRAQKEGFVFEDLDITESSTTALLQDYDIYLELKEDHVRLNTTIGNPRSLEIYTYYGEDSTRDYLDLNLKYFQWGNRQEHPIINIDGVDYAFGIGRIEDDEVLTFIDAGAGFGGEVCFSIVTGYNTANQRPASATVYNEILNQIENLKFTITDYYNFDDSQEECNLSLSDIEYVQWNGYNLPFIEVLSEPNMGVEARMEVTFTYEGEDYCIVYRPGEGVDLQTVFDVDASDLNIADSLNRVLSSKAALLSWFESKDAAAYRTYKANLSSGLIEMAEIRLKLPAADYKDIITVSVPGIDLTLIGHNNGTSMPGLRILRNRYPVYVQNIDFAVDKNNPITQTYNNNTFTCGVLAARAGDINSSAAGDARISDCSFTGFDYGVRSTEGGYATLNGPCQFIDCEVGYLLDCEGKGGGNGSEGMEECIFADCETAVRIISLPEDFAPYYWRITHCDFVNNHKDFDISAGGNFYFFRNYYGHFRNGADSLDDVTDLDYLQYKKPQVVNNKGTTVFTNPRRVSPYNILDGWKDDTLRVDNGRETPEGVIVITENYIPNDETDNLMMDTALLSEEVTSSGESINLSIIDKDEEVQATWTIN